MNPSQVIAIDGLSCVGKSTIAQALARMTGATYINTGYMYRAIGKLALQQKIDAQDQARVIALAQAMQFEFRVLESYSHIFVNGEDWTRILDDNAAIQLASKIAVIREVRDIFTQRQRECAQLKAIVMEGRDIGTVVFPDAQWKFFVSASFDVRIQRLYRLFSAEEMEKIKGDEAGFLKRLDQSDLTRTFGAVQRAGDAVEYDNSSSPNAEEDALVLNYYIKHPEEIQNRLITHGETVMQKARRFAEGGVASGKHS